MIAAVGSIFLVDVRPHLKVETDILALLPTDERDAELDQASRKFADGLSRRSLFLLGAPDFPRAKAAATQFAQTLRAPGAFSTVTLEVDAVASVIDVYRAHRDSLLSDKQRVLLASGDVQRLHDEALRGVYGLAGLARPLAVGDDPLNLLGDFLLSQLAGFGGTTLRDGVLSTSDGHDDYVLVTAESAEAPFSIAAQDKLVPVIESALAQARGQPDVKVLTSGLILHAAAASRQAQSEINTVGSVSMLGVLLLVWLTFRSLRPLALSLAALGAGALCAMTACHYIFGQVHLITLVFGTGLIGVAIDYSTHFLADQFRNPQGWSPRDAAAHVGPSILMGMLCAALGYLGLMLAPLPGLRQMAVFAIVGLAVSCSSVLLWYPVLARPTRGTAPLLLRATDGLDARLAQSSPRTRLAALALIAILVTVGLARVDFVDDIRTLQSSPPELMANERAVHEILRAAPDSRFFVVRATDAERVLQAEERLGAKLQTLIAQGALQGYVAVSRGVPSLQRQSENHALLAQKVYAIDGIAPRLLHELGFDDDAVRARLDAFNAATPLPFVAWLQSPASAGLRDLWLDHVGDGVASIVSLTGVRDPAQLAQLEREVPEAKLVDKVAQTSALMQRYRHLSAALIAAAYALIGVLLAVRYGFKVAPRLLAAPVGAAAIALAVFGWLGLPANLFNVLGLFMVLGLGVDYAVFLREGRLEGPRARSATVLAIALSTIGTVLSYGLLALSSTPFIRTLGLTLLVGIGATFVFALLAQSPADVAGGSGEKG